MLDEFESVYVYDNADPMERENRLRTLRCLSSMANCSSGRFAVILCGSSASLPYLISTKARAMEGIRERYPLAAPPNLNINKFRPFCVESGVPSDLEDLRNMLGPLQLSDRDEKVVAAVVAFLVGHNARALADFVRLVQRPLGSCGLVTWTVSQPTLSEGRSVLRPPRAPCGKIYDALLDATCPWVTLSPFNRSLSQRVELYRFAGSVAPRDVPTAQANAAAPVSLDSSQHSGASLSAAICLLAMSA